MATKKGKRPVFVHGNCLAGQSLSRLFPGAKFGRKVRDTVKVPRVVVRDARGIWYAPSRSCVIVLGKGTAIGFYKGNREMPYCQRTFEELEGANQKPENVLRMRYAKRWEIKSIALFTGIAQTKIARLVKADTKKAVSEDRYIPESGRLSDFTSGVVNGL